MAEHSIDLLGEFASPSLNGHQEPEKGARVDPERGLFITSRGDEIELSGKQISSLVIDRITNEGRPRIPMVEVTLMGKHKQLEAHPQDPGYLALLEQHDADSRLTMLRYLFLMGVKGTPPQAFVDDHRPFFPDAADADMKYLWVASRIPDDDIEIFMEAVMGQAMPTRKGLDEVADSFPGDGQRQPD